MIGHSKWDEIFDLYAIPVTSPDGKSTFETSNKLAKMIINDAALNKDDIVLDMGSGWGNLSLEAAPLVKQVIAIEPSKKNMEMAIKKAAKKQIANIHFIRGSFQKPNYKQQVDTVISTFVFHQVPHSKRQKSINNIYALLRPGGAFLISDSLLFFDPLSDPEKFNEIYRYLLPRTIPNEIFKRYVEPHFLENPEYIYTWDDMKKYTPRDNQFYLLADLKELLQSAGFKVDSISELAPFFGIIKAKKPMA